MIPNSEPTGGEALVGDVAPQETGSAADPADPNAADAAATETAPVSGTTPPEDGPDTAAPDPVIALLTEISEATRRLADCSERGHTRAEHREAVIDHQREEVDRLRLGERRGLLRPLLVEISRLRNDLLRQAGELPAEFDAERAALLLRSYADSIEIALENNGARTYAPAVGDAFDPRMHRRVGGRPATDSAQVGQVCQVSRDGYLDVDAGSPIIPAEVVVFGPVATPPAAQPHAEKENGQ